MEMLEPPPVGAIDGVFNDTAPRLNGALPYHTATCSCLVTLHADFWAQYIFSAPLVYQIIYS